MSMNKLASRFKLLASRKTLTQFNWPEARSSQLVAGNRGFTLLIAALISSVVLALGVSIFEIAIKQVTLSSIGRDSQFAFYAADTGAECALYWDIRHSVFGTSTPPDTVPHFQSGITDPKCDEQSLNVGPAALPTSYPYTRSFQFEPNGKCAQVQVEKCGTSDCDPDFPNIHTIIHADGYNTTCGVVDTSPRALQRSVELHY